MSSIAKVRLAYALKNLMQTKPLDKITIDELTQLADLNRNTFYYHFADIYDLLDWTFEQDIIIQVKRNLTAKNWPSKYRITLDYISTNRHFCLESLHSQRRDLLENFLFELGTQMVKSVVLDIDDQINPHLSCDLINFYGGAIASQVLQWLLDDLKTPKNVLISRATAILNGTIEFVIHKNTYK